MFRLERGPLLVTSLAVCYARQVFPAVDFVTDDRGAEIARALGWKLDTVNPALEHYQAEGLEHVWALGKLVALLLTEAPAIQFDGDVLLMRPLPLRMTKARLCAQSPDFPRYYLGGDMVRGIERAGFPLGINSSTRRAYNAGLIGGADLPLLHDYAAESLAVAQRFAGFDLNGTTASMIAEQYHLGVFARKRAAKVETLFASEYPTQAQVRRAGYVHLVGPHKRAPYYVARAEARLASQFPHAHAAFCDGWQHLTAHGSPAENSTVWASAL